MKALKIGSVPRLVDVENKLRALQREVLGCIECVQLANGGVMLVNEEGAISNLPQNPIASLVAGTMIYGPALIVGEDGEEFTDVPEAFCELLAISEPL